MSASADVAALRAQLNGSGRNLAAVNHSGPSASDEEAFEPLAELNDLLELAVGQAITGARLIGPGGDAAVFLTLKDGTEMTFASVRDMTRPANLLAELAVSTGARPKLNQARALDAVALIRKVAVHVASMDQADQAVEWGVGFLQAAAVLDVDLYDQAERWGAFSHLKDIDPRARHRETNVSVAAASVVLRHVDGSRLVRTDWLAAHLRVIEPRVTPAQLAVQMQRVGWLRRGTHGRWKATRPGMPGQLNWAFWLVPAGWEDRGEEAAVTASYDGPVTAGINSSPARAHAPALEAVTRRNPEDER